MLRTSCAALLLALLAAPAFVAPLHAAEPNSKKTDASKISVTGKISTVKKDVDEFTSIKLTTPDGKIYNITIDDKGKELAKQYDGISVQANGKTTTKDKDLWLTVESTGEKKKKKTK